MRNSDSRMARGLRARGVLAGVLVGLVWLVWVSNVVNASGVTEWSVGSYAYPSVFTPSSNANCVSSGVPDENLCDTYSVTVTNVGAKASNGTAVTIEDVLPSGVTAANANVFGSEVNVHGIEPTPVGCSVTGSTVKCVVSAEFFANEYGHGVLPDENLKLWVNVTVNDPGAPGPLVNTARAFGGGAAGVASASSENSVGVEAASFGFTGFNAPLLNVDGAVESQAGAHPYELGTDLDLNSVIGEDAEGFQDDMSVHAPRDVIVDLPPGLAGSAVSAPTCTLARLSSAGPKHENGESGCPADTIIGHIRTYPHAFAAVISPLYNIVPEKGVAAELGFIDLVGGAHVLYANIAPTPAGYVLRTTSHEIAEVPLTQIVASVYGDPAARDRTIEKGVPYTPGPGDVATFTNPDDCTGSELETTVYMDSWPSPGGYNPDGTPDLEGDPNWAKAVFKSPAVTGCEALAGLFKPEIEAHVETKNPAGGVEADSPTGLNVEVKVPQQQGVESLATPPLKEAVVTLPEGLRVNPSSANGLAACSEEQVGWQGKTPAASTSELEDFNAGVPNPQTGKLEATACPNASKIGTLEVETPALPAERCQDPAKALPECEKEETEKGVVLKEKTPLQGSIYLAKQQENPFGSLLAAYFVIDDARTGVVAKIPAKIEAGGEEGVTGLAAGQLRTVVKDSPQFPFSVLRTHFFGGSDASLRTPATCGSYTLSSQLTPWSANETEAPAEAGGSFEVTQAPGGGGCQTPPFDPSFTAGMSASSQAGAFSPFALSLSRGDDTQELKALNVTLPPGLAGKIAGIPLCPEADIQQAEARDHPGEGALEQSSPSCPAASEVGTVTVGAGAGEHPFYATGHAYLAGPYEGAPFDLVVITPAVAGPFDLGAVVVRNALYINPTTAQVTAKSGAFPTLLDGIPVDIRSIALNMNRPGFTFNPTSCAAMTITGEALSTQGQAASLSTPFYASNCRNLPFKPVLTATVAGQGSKAHGTTFKVTIQSPGLGQANIHKVDLTIPAKLPSRLSTIQKACPETVFDTNPANCDEGSNIGEGIVHTPLLNSPLRGPAYLVSHGNAAFPDVEFVLQGENVEIVLDGKTDIKNSVTYSRFETAPDAPFTTFETTLPAGPHSALTPSVPERENYNLCHTTITMPTEITAQNNAEITQNTPVDTTGCPTKISILSHKTKGHTLTLTLYIPTPGKLKLTGKNIHPTSTSTSQRTLTLKLHINNTKTPTKLQLTYTPTTGPKQTTHLTTKPTTTKH
jgi:uncharacterized repeat protein (TIGR01451 family)